MQILRWISDNTLKDNDKNEHIRGKTKVVPIEDKIRKNRLKWNEHVHLRPKDALIRMGNSKKLLEVGVGLNNVELSYAP